MTSFLTSNRHRTLYNRTSIYLSCILNAGHVGDAGDVVAVTVAVAFASGDGLHAAGDGRLTHRHSSWESHASVGSSDKAAETSTRMVGLLYLLLRDVIKETVIKSALMVLRLCHCWVRTGWVDPSANHTADIVYHFGMNLWRGRTKIQVEMTKSICSYIIHRVINVSCITHMLGSTSWTKLWRDPKLACFPGRQKLVDGRGGEGNECPVDFINQWSILHSHFSYAIEVCLVNKIHKFSCCKSKLALLYWSSRQRLNTKGTFKKREGNFELTSPTVVGHVNLPLANSQATIVRISVGDCGRNP